MPVADMAASANSLIDLPRLLEDAEGWAALIDGLSHKQSGVIDGAWGSSAALAAAALGKQAPSVLLIVLAHPADIDPWSYDLQSFLGAKHSISRRGNLGRRSGLFSMRCRANGCACCRNWPPVRNRLY